METQHALIRAIISSLTNNVQYQFYGLQVT